MYATSRDHDHACPCDFPDISRKQNWRISGEFANRCLLTHRRLVVLSRCRVEIFTVSSRSYSVAMDAPYISQSHPVGVALFATEPTMSIP